MTDLVMRLRNVTEDDAYAHRWTFGVMCREAADRIEGLEARLAAMTALHESDVENGTKLALEAINANNERAVLAFRLAAAEAGEDALAEALQAMTPDEVGWKERSMTACLIEHPTAVLRNCRTALAAYEARRKG